MPIGAVQISFSCARAPRLAALAAAFVAAGSSVAIAADLPTRKGAPAALGLATCEIGGFSGFALPGSNICLRIGGYVDAEISAGTLANQRLLQFTGAPGASPVTSVQNGTVAERDALGFASRGLVSFDAREATSVGIVRGYIELLAYNSTGFENTGSEALLNQGFVQVGGLTAGKAGSNFAYIAGGPNWYDFFSPDRFNGNQPLQLAYTFAFGDFKATLALEDPYGAIANGPVSTFGNAYYGFKAPDVVAALRYESGWGGAQLSGAAHETHVLGFSGDSADIWGWAALAGVTINLPALGPQDKFAVQAVTSRAALGYSGIVNTAWSPNDQGLNINGNGTIFPLIDALDYDTGKWSTPTTWSAAAYFQHRLTPTLLVAPEASIARVQYSGSPAMISTSATSEMVGFIAHFTPVAHLDFAWGAMFQATQQATPADYVGPEPFRSGSNGLATTLQIVRDF